MLEQLAGNGVRADAILLDLGVSSMQLDRPERGFSYAADAPLDMRMDPSADLTAAEVVNETGEWELADIFRRYGEERYARQIARAIVRRRSQQPFERTGDLVEVIKQAIPAPARFGEGHPAKRVFQALRIEVNDELGELERALPPALEMLRPHGRLAVISFHSLEDRIVKRFLRDGEHGCTCPPDFPRLRLRRDADAAGDPAAGDPAERGRGRPQPALRLGAPARGGEGWLAPGRPRSRHRRGHGVRPRSRLRGRPPSRLPRPGRSRSARGAEARRPVTRTRHRPRSRAAIAWIVIGGVLLAGVVFVNLAVLRLNLQLDRPPRRARSCAPRTRRSSRSSRRRSPRRGSRRSPRPRTASSRPTRRRSATSTLPSRRKRRPVSPIGDKQANRRIRLLLALFALAFACMFARAFWLQVVQAARPRRGVAQSQHEATRDDPGRPRHDLRPHRRRRSRSASRRRRSSPTPQLVRNPRAIALAAHDPRRRRQRALPASC